MGNCFPVATATPAADTNPTIFTNPSTNTRRSSDTGTSISASNNVGISTTDSSAGGHGRFWDDALPKDDTLPAADLKVYTFSDLKICTKSFKSDMVLGVGGFGTVYKGWVEEKTLFPSNQGTGLMVAIKRLNQQSVQGFREWQSEVNFLGRLSHPNVVKLLGYCREDKELLLVYEFMQKGSLENHLFRRINSNHGVQPLSWDLRMKIAIGAARGLAFIHSSGEKVIYRDIKASNILLDGNYSPKISDFGLAKLGPSGGVSHVTTRIMGTNGYLAPEYIATGHLYVKSDVYGFGIVLLEMMTGLRVLDSRRPGLQSNLVDWAKPLLPYRKKIKTMMDARIQGQYSRNAAILFAQLVLHCLESEPGRRPAMKEVLEVLEEINSMNSKPGRTT